MPVEQYDSRGNPILGSGVQDGTVAWLNQVLGWWGYTGGTSDVYDAATQQAVTAFQGRYGYARTGVMDEDTWGLMDSLMRGDNLHLAGRSRATGRGTRSQSTRHAPAAAAPAPGGTAPGSPGAPTGPGGGPGGASPIANGDALAKLRALLRQFGLDSEDMVAWANKLLLGGASEAQVQLELYDQPAFKKRFPAIEARQKAGLSPVTAAQVMAYEDQARSLLRRSGISAPALMEQDYLQKLMVNDISATELNDRLQDGLLKVTSAPPEVRLAFGNYFGTTGDAALAAFFLDKEKLAPELEKMAATAYAGGVGSRFNVMIGAGLARQIADTGASDQAIWQGFASIEAMKSVFDESIGEQTDLSAAVEGVGAAFNTSPDAKAAIEARVRGRKAAFSGGGTAAGTATGIVGLGVADS